MQYKNPGKHSCRFIATFCFSLAAISLLAAATVQSLNAPGDLDPTFGSGGKFVDGVSHADEGGGAVAVQPDGKIVVAGSIWNGSNAGFALARYNPDGSLDTSFDSDGKVTTPIGTSDILGGAVAIQPDGKIVAAGTGGIYPNYEFAIFRYNTDGSLDTTFDSDGKVTTPGGIAYAVVIQQDGKIVAAGRGLVRYNPDGSLDTTFDSDGKVTTSGGDALDVAIQNDGKIVAAGYGVSSNRFALTRYNADGSLDTTFDSDGGTDRIGRRSDQGRAIRFMTWRSPVH